MPDNIIRYKLLISCPGDVQEEISIIENCVNRFNDAFEDSEGISIKPIHWSKDSYPESGAKPQEILNKQIVKDCDAVVAIFWTRFGTPTDKYGSGTEEEIEIMLQNNKQVFLYFSDVPCSPSVMQLEGYKKIQDLKSRFADRGYYKTYKTYEEFEKTFFANLTRYFLTKQKVEQISRAKPQLVLRGIVGTQITEKARLEPVGFLASVDCYDTNDKIQELFSQIKNLKIKLSPKIQVCESPYFINENQPSKVVFGKEEKTIITKYVEEVLNESLDEEFFDLGNLCKRKNIFSVFGSGNPYVPIGSDEEKEKSKLLYDMYDLICERNNLKDFSEFYKSHPGIRLAVENIGTTYDEEIHITLKFPKGTIVSLKDLPNPTVSLLEFINEYINKLYGIPKTPNYEEYPFQSTYFPHIIMPLGNKNYHKELLDVYYSKLKRLFVYDFFQQEDNETIQIDYQSINHNFAVAFPSILFLSRTIDSIDYTIRSKHNPDIVKGTLAIEIDESLKTKEIQNL